MEQGKVNFIVVKFSDHKVPVFKEKKGKDWIMFGDKNDYPNYLLKLYDRSAKHRAIVDGKCSYIFGDGWSYDSAFTLIDKAKVAEFISGEDSINDLTKKLILDEELFGGFALEIIWDKAGRKIAEMNHIDFSYIRSNEDNSEFYFSKKWVKVNYDGTLIENSKVQEEEGFETYKPFDPENRKGKQLLYYKSYRPNLDVYPLPGYMGANVAIETDIEISNYHFNNLKNGFTATVLINFNNGVPTLDEQKKVEEQVKKQLTGSDNAGKFIVSFADGKDKSAEVIVLTMSDADKQFEQVRQDTIQEVFIGHRVNNPMLFGLMKRDGISSGRSEIAVDNELFQSNYVNDKQKIFEDLFNMLAGINGIPSQLKLTKKPPVDLDWFGNDRLNSLLTDQERREKAGLPQLPAIGIQDTLTALNSISPLVANKVIESMTVTEIRRLVGLPPSNEVSRTTVTTRQEYKADLNDQRDIEIFKKYGQPAEKFQEIKSRGFKYESDEQLAQSEEEFLSFAITIDLKTLDRSILDLLSKEPLTTPEVLAETLNTTTKKVNEAIANLKSRGLLKEGNVKSGDEKLPEITPTKKAENTIEAEPAKTVNIFIKYKYDKRPELKGPVLLDTSRKFCRDIIDYNRLFTRQEIESISGEVGYSVWLHRGGYYHNPNTGETTDFCRHEWRQVVVKEVDNG